MTGALTVGDGAVLTTITGFAVTGDNAPAALLAVLWAMRMEGKVESDA